MSVEDSYRIFPNFFHTLLVAPSLLRKLFNEILCVHRSDDNHHIVLSVESDEPELEKMIYHERGVLDTSKISAVYYMHISEDVQPTKILVAEYLYNDTVFFLYLCVVYVSLTYVGVIRVSQYGYRFFFSSLPEDVRSCMLRNNFIPPIEKKGVFQRVFERVKLCVSGGW